MNYHHALACRDLTNNNLAGSVPSPLLTKAQNGELILRLVLCLKDQVVCRFSQEVKPMIDLFSRFPTFSFSKNPLFEIVSLTEC